MLEQRPDLLGNLAAIGEHFLARSLECTHTCWLMSTIAMSGRSVKSVKAASIADAGVSGRISPESASYTVRIHWRSCARTAIDDEEVLLALVVDVACSSEQHPGDGVLAVIRQPKAGSSFVRCPLRRQCWLSDVCLRLLLPSLVRCSVGLHETRKVRLCFASNRDL